MTYYPTDCWFRQKKHLHGRSITDLGNYFAKFSNKNVGTRNISESREIWMYTALRLWEALPNSIMGCSVIIFIYLRLNRIWFESEDNMKVYSSLIARRSPLIIYLDGKLLINLYKTEPRMNWRFLTWRYGLRAHRQRIGRAESDDCRSFGEEPMPIETTHFPEDIISSSNPSIGFSRK